MDTAEDTAQLGITENADMGEEQALRGADRDGNSGSEDIDFPVSEEFEELGDRHLEDVMHSHQEAMARLAEAEAEAQVEMAEARFQADAAARRSYVAQSWRSSTSATRGGAAPTDSDRAREGHSNPFQQPQRQDQEPRRAPFSSSLEAMLRRHGLPSSSSSGSGADRARAQVGRREMSWDDDMVLTRQFSALVPAFDPHPGRQQISAVGSTAIVVVAV